MKRVIASNYEDMFWDRYDSDPDFEYAMTRRIDNLMERDKFFPKNGQPTATELEYKQLLDSYLDDFRVVQLSLDLVIPSDKSSDEIEDIVVQQMKKLNESGVCRLAGIQVGDTDMTEIYKDQYPEELHM